jgi:four helix bundle protein
VVVENKKMALKSYKDLVVWQKSVELCIETYKVTENYPKSELYGLTLQTRKSAVSIPSNIAEGQRRGHKAEYVQFLQISFGSGAELESQLLIANKIGYLPNKEYERLEILLDEVMRMLNGLLKSLK